MGDLIDRRLGDAARTATSLVSSGVQPSFLPAASAPMSIVVIDSKTLDRECLVRTISMSYPDIRASGFRNVEEWRSLDGPNKPKAVIYRASRQSSGASGLAEEVRQIVQEVEGASVIVIGETEDVRDMVDVFNCGARGYVPSSVGLDAIVEATRLSFSSGIFLPMSSLPALRDAFVAPPKVEAESLGRFTERQLAVCEALRRGKSNKTIAYELNLCESTVKVHIRAIMKKLRASNRTEAAFKLNAVCFGNDG